MKDLFVTPVTYRIEKETMYGSHYISKTYYSIAQAIMGFKMMHLQECRCIYWLVHLLDEQEVTRQRININKSTNV